MYGFEEIDVKLLVERFTDYLRFSCMSGNYRVTEKYKFIVYNYPNWVQYSALRKNEFNSFNKFKEFENENG